jgi:hypothetical protein
MKESMLESINRTTASWAKNSRKKRQTNNKEEIQYRINFSWESCENGEDMFSMKFLWGGT